MNRIAPYLLLLLVFTTGRQLYAQTLSETIVFEERVFNFGTIQEEKGAVTHTFIFKNTGKTPVTINDISTGCGCLGQVVTKDPVPAGGTGKLTITFNPEYKEGFFSKEIIVFSNNSQNFNRIWVEGTIIPGIRPVKDFYPYDFGDGLFLRLKVLAYGYVQPGQIRKMELHYANDTDKEMLLNFIPEGKTDGLAFVNPGRIPAKTRGVMSFVVSMPYFSNQDLSYKLIPYVNNKKLKDTLELKVLNDNKLQVRNQAGK